MYSFPEHRHVQSGPLAVRLSLLGSVMESRVVQKLGACQHLRPQIESCDHHGVAHYGVDACLRLGIW